MAWSSTQIASSLLFVGLLARWIRNQHASRSLPYPPGPVASLLTGNASDIPLVKPWLTYTKWVKKYGDLVHFRIFNQHFIILNSVEVATNLLTKRSAIYSDRPTVPMVGLTGWDFNFAMFRYGDRWRRCRRLSQQVFKPEIISEYRPIQLTKTHDFLRGLLSTPERWMDHNRTLSAAITMSMLYGYDIAPTNDYFVSIAEHAMDRLGEMVAPGAFAVNLVPALRHLPAWFPGCATLHKYIAETRVYTSAMRDRTFEFVKGSMVRTGVFSFEDECLQPVCLAGKENEGQAEEDEDLFKELAATAYAGGADTTVASMGTFFLAMVMHPHVTLKAQEELDRAIGQDRLPIFEDRPNCPYTEAIVREVFRYRPVGPLGIAHSNVSLDVYNGYVIPQGTIVQVNIWAMTRNESVYPDAESFKPERFISSDGSLNNDDLSFTFGKNIICVGRHLAYATMWLAVASFLSVFDISKAKDENGNEIPIIEHYSGDGLVSQPRPFRCAITPRSQQAVRVIQEAGH
ncbi:cytochrome P450 [Mycena floridula]|nr:cytochrome P450 [Mycena floridula]KAJ7577305.1 cytochrome P450 [Mycena floridula]